MAHTPKQGAGILVVDDEAMVLQLYTAILQQMGWQVFTASSGQAAEQLYRKHAAEIDLVITEMQFRGDGDGVTLAEQLRTITPALLIVGVTDWVPERLRLQALKCVDEMLEKPFEIWELQHLVAEVSEKK